MADSMKLEAPSFFLFNKIKEINAMENENLFHQKKIKKDHLVNKLNHIHFNDETILVGLKHLKNNQTIFMKAKPQPCSGDELICTWPESEEKKTDSLSAYIFSEIRIVDGKNILIIHPEDIEVGKNGTRFLLPETCLEVDRRRLERHACEGITARMVQNSVSFKGCLIDISPVSFKVELKEEPGQRFFWINPDLPVTLILSDSRDMYYSGECNIFKDDKGRITRQYVLQPLNMQLSRFRPKTFRTSRHKLIPSPYAVFIHPFTHQRLTLKISDMSGGGFSVEEDEERTTLIPGMILPELELNYVNSLKVKCKAQVIYRSLKTEKNRRVAKTGLAILDMDLEEHGKLLALLNQINDDNSFMCNEIDLDDLWRFFFESGFLYPKKYGSIHTHKDHLKAIYQKIYNESPTIARHFIYTDNDRILSHLAMIRFYEKSWMIHHHASNRTISSMAGINVMHQIARFINESHSIFSVKMDYVFCYYRPENKFPDRIFGGASRNADDPKKCSLDLFSYFHYQKPTDMRVSLKHPWNFAPAVTEDLVELRAFYESLSGGLMLDALEVSPESESIAGLVSEYQQQGFKRDKFIYSLKKDGILKAVVMINISDFGLNLSNLTDSVSVFITDPQDFPQDIFDSMLSMISHQFNQKEITVLLYPEFYAQYLKVNHDKSYFLWVLNTQHSDSYFGFLNRYFKKLKSYSHHETN